MHKTLWKSEKLKSLIPTNKMLLPLLCSSARFIRILCSAHHLQIPFYPACLGTFQRVECVIAHLFWLKTKSHLCFLQDEMKLVTLGLIVLNEDYVLYDFFCSNILLRDTFSVWVIVSLMTVKQFDKTRIAFSTGSKQSWLIWGQRDWIFVLWDVSIK